MPLRVLIVQAEEQQGQSLARFFRERGDMVWVTSALKEATDLALQQRPNILLFDLHYPGNDWPTFLRLMQTNNSEMKLIITNRRPDLQRELLVNQIGVRAFLRAPFDPRWIERALQRAEQTTPQSVRSARAQPAPRVRVPVRLKITLPYLILSLVFALASALIISQVLLENAQERYLNQLIETGRQSADWVVREEDRLLGSLRLVANTQGLAEALRSKNAELLRTLVLPLAANAGEEDIEVLDAGGVSVLSLRLKQGGANSEYEFTRGDTLFGAQDFVLRVLTGESDPAGDKFSGVILAPWGTGLYVTGPVLDEQGQRVGVVLVGKSLRSLAQSASAEVVGRVTFYDRSGKPLASTLFNSAEVFPVAVEQAQQVLSSQDQNSLTRNLNITTLEYSEILGPWELRGGNDVGLVGTALVRSFFTRTSNITQVQIIVLVTLVILLVVGVGVILANRITMPLVELADASTRVAQGDLEVKVKANGNDEVAVLAHSFNSMLVGLQEGSVYRDLLGRTVSPEVREQLRQSFSSGDLRLEGQETVATILMTDIRSFTTLTEHADPARVLAWLNEYFGRLVPIITAHGGVVNKFDGDALLAFFGILPKQLAPKESALAACRAALEMLTAIDDLNRLRVERGELPLVTGIGINTGLVIAGGLGASDRIHYTIIGDSVNTAQRLETLTRQLITGSGALMGEATFQALGETTVSFHMENMGAHAVKGKTDRVTVYRLLTGSARSDGDLR